MARMKPEALRSIHVDGESLQVPQRSLIEDVVPREVSSISAVDPGTGAVRLISRDQFRQVVPPDFVTHLTPIAKGGVTVVGDVGDDSLAAAADASTGVRPVGATYIVSRHPGAVDWVRQRLSANDQPRVVDHVDDSMAFSPGDQVCGVLPMALAARICMQGARPLVIDLQVPPELRGRELSHAQLDALGASLVEYEVRELRRL